jgi:hypothetical protein
MRQSRLKNRTISIFIISLLVCTVFVGIINVIEDVEASIFHLDSSLSDSQASFYGETTFGNVGMSVASAGDVNNDSYDDILIGAPYNDQIGLNAGKTYLILGKPSGWAMDFNLSNADASFIGESADDQSGFPVTGAGDVNGDGFDDILIGARRRSQTKSFQGKAYLIFGKASGWIKDMSLADANASFLGEDGSNFLGKSVSGAGDVNKDVFDDVLIGAWWNKENGDKAGQAYLVLGKSSGWSIDTNISKADASFLGEYADNHAGVSVAGAGDVNSDGYDDILVGAELNSEKDTNAGQVYLILGKSSGWKMDTNLSSSDASFLGESLGDHAGFSVSGAGDVNGDSYDDFLIGAYLSNDGVLNSGQVYLIFGKPSGWFMDTDLDSAGASYLGEYEDDWAGYVVAGAGNVNGDAYDDIFIGARYNDEGANDIGQAYLVFGKASGWSKDVNLSAVDASFIGEDGDDEAGFSVAFAGDVNRDGLDDVLVGAPWDEEGGSEAGQVYLLFYDIPPPPDNLEVTFSKNGDYLNITWGMVDFWDTLRGFMVYRSEDGITYHELGFVNPDTRFYNDSVVVLGRTYMYSVSSISWNHIESHRSNAIAVLCDYDTDLDGISNNVDIDDDRDGVLDVNDAFPLDISEDADFDNDGIGDNADLDDDNDDILDIDDDYPLNPFNDLETYLRNQMDNLDSKYAAIDLAITSLSDLIDDDEGPTRGEILDKINDSIASIQGLEANTTAHDSDIKSVLDSLTDLLDDEHELTNNQLLENLTSIINQLGDIESDILREIGEINETIDSLDEEDTESKDTQDSTYTMVLLGVVLLVLILIILLIGIAILIKENRSLRNAMTGSSKGELPEERELRKDVIMEPEEEVKAEE